ncbi:unnamed protein product, partial [Prorocentrum cordatum]
MDDARKLLDSLMGPSRNADEKERARQDGWKDKSVCKRYLVGFCPNDANDNWFKFKSRGRDQGLCYKVHSEALKRQFEAHSERDRYQREYEKEFLSHLENLVSEADAWIAREKKNCRPAGMETRIPIHLKFNMDQLKKDAEECVKRAEELAEKGDVEGSKRALADSDRVKQDIVDIWARFTFQTAGETVCEVCGIRCQPDEPVDYEAHLQGKLHRGYLRIREKVEELRAKKRPTATPSLRPDFLLRREHAWGSRSRVQPRGRGCGHARHSCEAREHPRIDQENKRLHPTCGP